MLLSKINFGSLFAYTPRPHDDETRKSKTFMIQVKQNEIINFNNLSASQHVVNTLVNRINSLPFSHFFQPRPVLVPIPKSSLFDPDALWVPSILAQEMYKKGLGEMVIYYVDRVSALPKSASSAPENRPKAFQHFESVEIRKNLLSNPHNVLLIDDVVTRGATILGIASKLSEVFPDCKINSFAAIRTISDSKNYTECLDPKLGTITLNDNDTYRNP